MASISESLAVEGVKLLKLEGGLTYEGVVPVSKSFEAATAVGNVIVDLSGVQLVTTPGISLLLSAHQRLGHNQGRLVLCAVPANLKDVLKRCRLDRVFTFAADEAAALTIAQQPPPPPRRR